uniref:Uncharacterized protein n=1 Tax=Lepeophtheirus salmonis TaxID=72036 RepID=A0A0K2V3R0_LEPSM
MSKQMLGAQVSSYCDFPLYHFRFASFLKCFEERQTLYQEWINPLLIAFSWTLGLLKRQPSFLTSWRLYSIDICIF